MHEAVWMRRIFRSHPDRTPTSRRNRTIDALPENLEMALGDSLAAWGPLDASPPPSGFATLDVRNAHPVLDFDAGLDEAAIFEGVFPAHYGGGNLQIEIHWAATSATSGNVKWNVAIENTSDADIDGDGFGTESTATASTTATSGGVAKTSLSVSAANAGSPQAGDAFRILVTRDGNDAADTMSGDAELVAIHLREA
jgi:hypothetical protein